MCVRCNKAKKSPYTRHLVVGETNDGALLAPKPVCQKCAKALDFACMPGDVFKAEWHNGKTGRLQPAVAKPRS